MAELRKDTIEFLKILADPVRLEILYFLKKSVRSSSGIQKELKRSQSTISKHLSMLVDARLIEYDKRDNLKYYRIKNTEVFELLKNINSIVLKNTRERLRDVQDADIFDTLS